MVNQTITHLFGLIGKVAIVTGGATGIGQAIAFRLAEAGASVVIADIDEKTAGETMSQIKAKGGKALAIRIDVSNMSDVRNLVQATVETLGSLDILVNNAAIYPPTTFMEISEELWDKVQDTNLKGTFLCSQVAAIEMIKAGHGGKIINIASCSAIHPVASLAHYEASKAGVVMLTKSLALEFGPQNILVNAVAPGTIVTPGLMKQAGGFTVGLGISYEKILEDHAAKLPLRRVGEPDDIAKVVLFLASSAANYMTGVLVPVEGGLLLL